MYVNVYVAENEAGNTGSMSSFRKYTLTLKYGTLIVVELISDVFNQGNLMKSPAPVMLTL